MVEMAQYEVNRRGEIPPNIWMSLILVPETIYIPSQNGVVNVSEGQMAVMYL